jgi:hypothetical protein
MDALFYCTHCDTIFCAEHVCPCNGVIWQLREPAISPSGVQLYQPVHFPAAPSVFVGGYREGNIISYYFCKAKLLFAEGDIVPAVVYHFDIHPPWRISRMRVVPMVMLPRALMYPIPQFIYAA